MKFLSFDCGIKTLAWVLLDITQKKPVPRRKKFALQHIVPEYFDVIFMARATVDLAEGRAVKSLSESQKIKLVVDYIKSSPISPEVLAGALVVIELQPFHIKSKYGSTNFDAIKVSHALASCYMYGGVRVEFIHSASKDRISFSPDLTMENFHGKEPKREHSVANTKYLAKLFGQEMEDGTNHEGDAVLQAIAFVIRHQGELSL